MKRNILLLLVALLPVMAVAYDAEINGIYYNFSEDNAIVTYRSRLMAGYESDYFGTVVIPKSVTYNGKTYNVTGIGECSFWNCTNLTSVTIPEGVTSIGYNAFQYCSSLTSISVALMNMNYDSRDNCNAIIETATNTLIAGCQNTIIPNSVTRIGDGAFSGCRSLTSITIPNSVTSIGAWAFSGCSSLTSVTIPEGVPSIGNYAFSGCRSLTSITIPSSVTSIHEDAFYGCYFAASAFVNNSALTTNYWGATICDEETDDGLLIKDNVVVRCRPWATSVTIPEGMTSIGDQAFMDCSNLTSVTIPSSVTSIGSYAFDGCSSLISISVALMNMNYDSRDNCNAIIETATNTLIAGCQNTIIPNSVTSIGPWAFALCTNLTSVTIPEGVTSIGGYAFEYCSGLTSITIPNSVTSIGPWAFALCTNLTSVTIPEGVTSIGSEAFDGCSSLTSVTIPEGVESINMYTFASCTSLEDVYCYAKDVPLTDDRTFYSSPISSATLHVPAASIEEYKRTAPWSNFGTIVALTEQEIADAIEDVDASNAITDFPCYNTLGRQISSPQKGINIIRYSDGTSKKVLLK